MKNIFFLTLFCLNATAGMFAQSADVLENERQRFRLMTEKDTAALAAFLSDDLIYVHSNALVETKAEHLKTIGTGKITYEEMTTVNPVSVRKFRKAAYTYGNIHVRGFNNGNPFDVVLHYSALYEKRHGRWVLLNWQSTKIK